MKNETQVLRKLVEDALIHVAALRLTDADDHLPFKLNDAIAKWTKKATRVLASADDGEGDA